MARKMNRRLAAGAGAALAVAGGGAAIAATQLSPKAESDLSFDRVIPHHVMTGFRAWEFGGPVHAGIVVGWVHKPAALIAERRVGRGGLAACTFRLFGDAPLVDPVAASLFDAMIAIASAMAVEPAAG